MTEATWIFDSPAASRVTVDGVPRGDRAAEWFDVAVPQIAAAGLLPRSGPTIVVAHVSSPRPVGAPGLAKRLMDALHDQRRSGPRFESLGVTAPLYDDHPESVTGLAVEVRPAPAPTVEYLLGSSLEVLNSTVIAEVAVDVDCPNDIGASSEENRRLREARLLFANAVAGAWPSGWAAPQDDIAVVIRHARQRDEDNTWEGWLGVLGGRSGSADLWASGAPLAGRSLKAVASLQDARLACGVRYELHAVGSS